MIDVLTVHNHWVSRCALETTYALPDFGGCVAGVFQAILTKQIANIHFFCRKEMPFLRVGKIFFISV